MGEQKCQGHTDGGRIGLLPCINPAKVVRDGKHYCGVHDPDAVLQRQNKRDVARREAERQAEARRNARPDGRAAGVAASEKLRTLGWTWVNGDWFAPAQDAVGSGDDVDDDAIERAKRAFDAFEAEHATMGLRYRTKGAWKAALIAARRSDEEDGR